MEQDETQEKPREPAPEFPPDVPPVVDAQGRKTYRLIAEPGHLGADFGRHLKLED